MLNSLAKLAQKPTDKNIRIVRIVFAVLLLVIIYFGWNVTVLNFGLSAEIKFIFVLFPLIGLTRGIFDPGLVRKGVWRWIIVTLGAIMLMTSLILIDDMPLRSETQIPTTVSGELNIENLTDVVSTTDFTLSTDNWFGFFGFVLVIIGFLLNNKNITTKNERFGEKVTKIRV